MAVPGPSSGGLWTSAPPNPGGAPDRPFSNRGLDMTPSFQAYSFDLPVGDGPEVQIRFRFDTVDETYQGFRGVAVDQVNVNSPDLPREGFEQGAPGWTLEPASGPGAPSWRILTNPENLSVKSPEINPELVTLPDLGALPAAPAGAGNHVAWFGNTASGTFCGPDFANRVQQPDSTPPDTPILSGPPAFTNDPTPTFTFTSTEPGSTFTCSLDGGAFIPLYVATDAHRAARRSCTPCSFGHATPPAISIPPRRSSRSR